MTAPNLLNFCLIFLKNVLSDSNTFPKEFLFGAATSAYQTEGGWNEDGKSNSIWDHLFHSKEINKGGRCWTVDCSDGDTTSDSYHNYKRDIEMLKEIGAQVYRFSISWSRIMPSGFPNRINKAGVDYYNNLINELIKHGIKPMITLYHFDLPQSLQDLGGWANPLIEKWFADYSRVIFSLFGDRVKLWITINEPMMVCQMGYGDNILAPAIKSYGIGNYICFKNTLLAHARVWHVYDEEFRSIQNGVVGISISMMWYEPLTDSSDDIEATRDMRSFEDWVGDPIFSKDGDFPLRLKQRIAVRSAQQGFVKSRLPTLSENEIKYIRGSADFYGLNAYATFSVYRNGSKPGYTDHHGSDFNVLLGKYEVPSYADDLNASITIDPEYNPSMFLTDYPPGFYYLLKYIKQRYQNPVIYVTENGICTGPGLEDDIRVNFLRGHIDVLKKAMNEGVDVRAYISWSLLDSFEWNSGYTIKFGLYETDFNDPNRTRVPKKSAKVYAQIIRERKVTDARYKMGHSKFNFNDLTSNSDRYKPSTIYLLGAIALFIYSINILRVGYLCIIFENTLNQLII